MDLLPKTTRQGRSAPRSTVIAILPSPGPGSWLSGDKEAGTPLLVGPEPSKEGRNGVSAVLEVGNTAARNGSWAACMDWDTDRGMAAGHRAADTGAADTGVEGIGVEGTGAVGAGSCCIEEVARFVDGCLLDMAPVAGAGFDGPERYRNYVRVHRGLH